MTEEFNRQLVEQIPRLRSFALSLTRNASDADDLMQTTAVQALRGRNQFMPGTNFAAWTRQIMKNQFFTDCRSTKRRPVPLEDVPEELFAAPGDLHEHVLARQALGALNRLSPLLKQALGLACGELSYGEIGAVASCSLGTVKSRIWRARRKLKDFLPDHYDAPVAQHARSTWKNSAPLGLN